VIDVIALSPRHCDDDNKKIVKRTYLLLTKHIEISLCKQHASDPDFSDYIFEVKI